MIVNVIEFRTAWIVIQYDDQDGFIQRRWVPRCLITTTSKGEVNLPQQVISAGMEYSNVDLPGVLGQSLRIQQLQDRLRREGLWMADDYRRGNKVVADHVQRLQGLNTTAVLNVAALRRK